MSNAQCPNVCSPIVHKPKPKPKVESPKEEGKTEASPTEDATEGTDSKKESVPMETDAEVENEGQKMEVEEA